MGEEIGRGEKTGEKAARSNGSKASVSSRSQGSKPPSTNYTSPFGRLAPTEGIEANE